ncbi:putative symporter YjmB [Blautia producta]|uniref:Putative symporter YjmB n=1 Tax=Blautia producta TaxID=33035 RepID=A0A4P6LY51_9FIRM|nr:MFS transporter [Blautia producta]QBE96775.1 putative symporter YjmB [Blautia producta]
MEITSSKKEIWTMGSYSLLTLAIMVGFMYLNTFATEVLVIPAGTLALALGVAKLLDFCFSLFAGAIIEKVKIGKTGKNQSWLYLGRWILAVSIMAEVCNTSAAPLIVRVAVLSVSYTVLNCLMNILQTAYYGVLAAVAGPNMANRNAMTINMTRQSTVITIICSFIPTFVTVLPFGNWNYFIVAFVFMLPMPFALGAIAKCADGKDVPVGATGSVNQVGIGDMFGTLLKNPQMLILFLVFTILYIAQFTYQANYTYYFIYVVGDFTKMTLATLINAFVGFLAAMVMPKLGAKLGKKMSCVFGFAMMSVALILVSFFGAPNGVPNLTAYIIIMSLLMAGTYTWMPYMVVLFLDAGEYFLYKTGKDTRAIAAGLASPPMKIGMTVGNTLGLALLSAIGFVSGGAFEISVTWITNFMRVTFMLPGLIYLAAAIIMLLFYKISDKDAAMYAQANAEKMQQSK